MLIGSVHVTALCKHLCCSNLARHGSNVAVARRSGKPLWLQVRFTATQSLLLNWRLSLPATMEQVIYDVGMSSLHSVGGASYQKCSTDVLKLTDRSQLWAVGIWDTCLLQAHGQDPINVSTKVPTTAAQILHDRGTYRDGKRHVHRSICCSHIQSQSR